MPRSRSKTRNARNYAAEYARQIARALARGQSRSQARGHPRPGEGSVFPKRPPKPIPDEDLQRALQMLRKDKSLSTAARSVHVSPERLKHAAASKGAINKQGRRWVLNPKLPRRLPLYSRGRQIAITVGDAKSASRVGSYMSAVARFLEKSDRSLLQPFVGQFVSDISGKTHPFETNPNTLYRLSSVGGESVRGSLSHRHLTTEHHNG